MAIFTSIEISVTDKGLFCTGSEFIVPVTDTSRGFKAPTLFPITGRRIKRAQWSFCMFRILKSVLFIYLKTDSKDHIFILKKYVLLILNIPIALIKNIH